MVWAVVVAAGKGERAGFGDNKIFHPIAGVSALGRTLRALADSGVFDGAVLVLAPGDRERYENLAESEGRCPLVRVLATGGDTRGRSVYNGLLCMPPDVDVVAVHDAARPFVSGEIVRATVASAREYGSGVIATPVTDTVKRVDAEGYAVETPERSHLRAVQTPQAFRLREILRAYEAAFAAGESATDDAAVYERHIGRVRLVTTSDACRNNKLTTKADFDAAERTLSLPDMRIGMGYDAHRLVEGRKLILCGVEIPFERGLLGHSDADAAVHALMDAILGAAGLCDIGELFPDSDPRYAGISSMRLLQAVMEKVAESGLRVSNVDITILAQRPKLAPYRSAMRANLAAALGLPENRVNVKASTTERMGFEGLGEGVSAQAAALLCSR